MLPIAQCLQLTLYACRQQSQVVYHLADRNDVRCQVEQHEVVMRQAVAGLLLCFIVTANAEADDNQISIDATAGNWVAQSGTDDYGKHLCAAFGEGEWLLQLVQVGS